MSALTVYIVEDSPTIRQNLAAALEELAPVRVVGWAATAPEALAALTADTPPCELAIVDLSLRQGSGLDVLKALQARRSGLRLVVLSNFTTPAMRTHCLALGADQVFDKSGEVDALVAYCEALALGPR